MQSVHKKAVERYTKALNYYTLAGKGNELDVADELEALGASNTLLGEHYAAQKFLERAQQIRIKMSGDTHQTHIGPEIPTGLIHAMLRSFSYSANTNLSHGSQKQKYTKSRKKKSHKHRR